MVRKIKNNQRENTKNHKGKQRVKLKENGREIRRGKGKKRVEKK